MFLKWLVEIKGTIAILIILSYLLFLILATLLPTAKKCATKCRTFLTRRVIKLMDNEVNMEDRALLNQGSADYNSCH